MGMTSLLRKLAFPGIPPVTRWYTETKDPAIFAANLTVALQPRTWFVRERERWNLGVSVGKWGVTLTLDAKSGSVHDEVDLFQWAAERLIVIIDEFTVLLAAMSQTSNDAAEFMHHLLAERCLDHLAIDGPLSIDDLLALVFSDRLKVYPDTRSLLRLVERTQRRSRPLVRIQISWIPGLSALMTCGRSWTVHCARRQRAEVDRMCCWWAHEVRGRAMYSRWRCIASVGWRRWPPCWPLLGCLKTLTRRVAPTTRRASHLVARCANPRLRRPARPRP